MARIGETNILVKRLCSAIAAASRRCVASLARDRPEPAWAALHIKPRAYEARHTEVMGSRT
jgi:hypothetical protein